MTKILAIETCSESCSVALLFNGEQQQQISTEPRGHADAVLPMVERLLQQADIRLKQLDVIAFTRGPGAFTGVRIGTSVAQGLALATDLPLIAVSSLAVLAQGSYRETAKKHCLAALDARMSEVYFGVYQLNKAGLMLSTEEDQVAKPENVLLKEEKKLLSSSKSWQVAGAGWVNYKHALQERFRVWNLLEQKHFPYPQAQDLLTQANWYFDNDQLIDPAQAIPVYVRDKVVRS